MAASDASRIKDVFAEAQYSVSAHKNLQNNLKKIHNSMSDSNFFRAFTECLKVPLMCGEKTSPAERTLDFAVSYIVSCITKKVRPETEDSNEDEDDDDMPKFVRDIFGFMCENIVVDNQTIRFRICQFINKLLNGLGSDASMDDDLCDQLCDRLLERLRDKSPIVRTQAVRALYRLQDPLDANCRVTSTFIYHMGSDPSADVRGTILTNIAVSSHSVRAIVERTRDTSDTVRKVAYTRMAELNIQRFSIEQRVRLLERGLKDQSEKVRKCVTNDLLRSWYDTHKGNFVSFLLALDCEHSTETSSLALETLFKSIKAGLNNAIEQVRALQGSDKLIPVEELTPEKILLWKVVYEYLEKHPEIAEERPIDDPLEDIVPELSTFCSYILKFFDQPVTSAEPWVYVQKEYILARLLEMSEGFDFSDEMGRSNLRSMCQTLLLNNSVSDRVVPLLVKITTKVIPGVDDRLQFLAEVIAELHDPTSDAEEPVQEPVVQMSAEEKRQLEIKEAKIKMKLNELTEDQDDAVKAKDFIRAQTIQEECQKLRNELEALKAPPVEKPATQEVRNETQEVVIKDKSKLQKCLCIVREMMQSPTVESLTPTLRSLMHNFVMPCLQKEDVVLLKNMALEAMGLFCLLDEELAKQHFVYMFCFQIANDEVCETALKITFDLLHYYGLNTFEVEENNIDETETKRTKKKKNLFVTETQNDEFEDEDEPQNQTLNRPGANTSNLIGMLTSLLDSASISMRNLAMKGLCKLLLACRMTSPALLSRLIVMWYSPVTDGDEEFRQPMAAFLNALSTICPRGQEMLEQAFRPTLKTLRDAPADSPLSEIDVESVTKLFISLTRPGINRFHKKQNSHVHNTFAVTLCNELLNLDDGYFDDGIFLRSLLQLELCLDDPVFRQDLTTLAASMRYDLRMRKEIKTLLKYVERFFKMIEPEAAEEPSVVPEVDNTARTEQLNGTNTTVVKKSRKNAKILRRGDDSVEIDDDESDTSIVLSTNRLTEGVVIPESPPPERSENADSQEDSQEVPEVQDPKRRRVSAGKSKSLNTNKVNEPGSSQSKEAGTGKEAATGKEGRRRPSEEQTTSKTGRRAAKAKTAESLQHEEAEPTETVKETGRSRTRRAGRTDDAEEGEETQSKRRRKSDEERNAEVSKEAPKEKSTRKSKDTAVGQMITGRVVKVVLSATDVDGRPRREVKLTARAMAYQEDRSKKSPHGEGMWSPTRSPGTPKTPSSKKSADTGTDTTGSATSSARKDSGSQSQSDNGSPLAPKKLRRSARAMMELLQKNKSKAMAERADPKSLDETSSQSPVRSRPQRRGTVPMVDVSTSRNRSPMSSPSSVAMQRQGTRSTRNRESSSVRTRTGRLSDALRKKLPLSSSPSTQSSDSSVNRSTRSKAQSEDTSTTSSKAVTRTKPTNATSSKDSPVVVSTSDSNSSPERRPFRLTVQKLRSRTDPPCPAGSSSKNVDKRGVKVLSEKPPLQSSSSEETSGSEESDALQRAKGSVRSTRLSGQAEVLEKAVDRLRRSLSASSPQSSPNEKVSRSSTQDDVLQRAVERVRSNLSMGSPSKSSPTTGSSTSNTSPEPMTRRSRSTTHQEASYRTLRRSTSEVLPAAPKKTISAAPRRSSERSARKNTPSKQTKSDTDSSSSRKNTPGKVVEKSKSKTSLGRLSSGEIASPTMSTRSQDLPNRLRTRKQ